MRYLTQCYEELEQYIYYHYVNRVERAICLLKRESSIENDEPNQLTANVRVSYRLVGLRQFAAISSCEPEK